MPAMGGNISVDRTLTRVTFGPIKATARTAIMIVATFNVYLHVSALVTLFIDDYNDSVPKRTISFKKARPWPRKCNAHR
ncbi:MAG: hypothetical protein DDT18_01627 [Actinobacteria bacterium]|nr:hypothetical protein [Actinomycetota bacterium]GFP42621.1 hypothetical protein HKBW3C_01745 [Candidatus Hakubella thermalkaliphila]